MIADFSIISRKVVGKFRLPFVGKIILVHADDLLAHHFRGNLVLEQDFRGKRRNLLNNAVEKVFGANVVMVQIFRKFLARYQRRLGSAR
jgi:hypothetical protein